MGIPMKEKFTRYDTADYLKTEKDIEAYLQAAMEDDDPQSLAIALGNVVRARNVTALARETGLTREGLYKAFSARGNPSYATVSKVSRAMGFRLQLVPDAGRELEDHFVRPHDPPDPKYSSLVVNLSVGSRGKRQGVRTATKGLKTKGNTVKPKASKAAHSRRSKT
jgi:probable addiction module antidote protein